jgi:light-regulated signal transduction histidine kinase (bacteriophytochrome)
MNTAPAFGDTLRLLIVDDSPEDRTVYRRLLSGSDFTLDVAEAESADQGLELCREFRPHCLLLDYRLPDMTGLEFLADLATQHEPWSIAVVMLTGQGDETVAVEAMKWGAQDYLVKASLTPDNLNQAIASALNICMMRRTIADQRRRLEQSNRELERYARVVAHDLESPLKAIRSGLSGLLERSGDKLDAKSGEFVRETMETAERMARLIRAILDYSRASGETPPHVPVDMNGIAAMAVQNLKAPIAECGAAVKLEPLPVISGDENTLLQLMQNLIGNAIKYRVAGRTPEVRVWADTKGDAWQFHVQDNGVGLDPAKAERIFEPFIRLHHEYEGTGVGLAICRAVVERHGGKIWVTGEPGKGATFTFSIPAREHSPAPSSTTAPAAA